MADEFNINEWLLDEYIRVRDALADLTRRHVEIVSHLADVCQRNNRMQSVGNVIINTLNLTYAATEDAEIRHSIDELIQVWTEANT